MDGDQWGTQATAARLARDCCAPSKQKGGRIFDSPASIRTKMAVYAPLPVNLDRDDVHAGYPWTIPLLQNALQKCLFVNVVVNDARLFLVHAVPQLSKIREQTAHP